MATAVDILRTLQGFCKQNPNWALSVDPIEIRRTSDTQEGEDGPASGPGGWVPTPLDPPGPVALMLWKTNPEFRAGGSQVRRTILRDTIIELTERVKSELKGVRWSRKKVLEQLAAQMTAAVSPPMDTPELDRALAELYNVQLVLVDEANKKVRFVPEDPRVWSAESDERQVWGASHGCRAIFHATREGPISAGLGRWVSSLESAGWRFTWPEAEGALEEMKKEMLAKGIGVGTGLDKPKKADYAVALGKAQAVRRLAELFG
jgi:hypothetical protein